MKIFIVSLFVFLSVVYFALWLYIGIFDDYQHKFNEQINKMLSENIPQFSVSDYLQRIQCLSDELQHEKEQSDNYRLVLWWGINGLKLNVDGTSEWIKKESKKYTSNPVSISPIPIERYDLMVQQTCCTSQYPRLDALLQVQQCNMNQCQQSHIDELRMQNTMLQLQYAQQQQAENLLKASNSTYRM